MPSLPVQKVVKVSLCTNTRTGGNRSGSAANKRTPGRKRGNGCEVGELLVASLVDIEQEEVGPVCRGCFLNDELS